MMKSVMKRVFGSLLAGGVLIATAAALEPMVSSRAALEAAPMVFHLSSTGQDYCEGCCAWPMLCCNIPVSCPPD